MVQIGTITLNESTTTYVLRLYNLHICLYRL